MPTFLRLFTIPIFTLCYTNCLAALVIIEFKTTLITFIRPLSDTPCPKYWPN
jgi:hypothetical protein